MISPPINRSMRILDRTFFQKECLLSAASVLDKRTISRVRAELVRSRDMFAMRNVQSVKEDPVHAGSGRKCILLRPEIKHSDKKTWSETTTHLANQGDIDVIPFNLHLNYDHWSPHEILSAVLPEDLHDEIPTGFNAVGHVAHFNLRDKYLPCKHIIAQITLSKNPTITTVINKTETLDDSFKATNPFRTLDYEVLAGTPNLDVEVKEAGATFRFDFGKVFWNSRLGTEHARLVEMFRSGEAVCDVMAGVGPFAVPAAKKGVFVWANDLNPHCFGGLRDAVALNKVGRFVKSFNEDGHEFIKSAARRLLKERHVAKVPIKMSRTEVLQRRKEAQESSPAMTSDTTRKTSPPAPPFKTVQAPPTFDHFVMNLPASATEFLPSFIGIYADHEHLFELNESATTVDGQSTSMPVSSDSSPQLQKRRLPMIHCYCFGSKDQISGSDGEEPSAHTNGHVEQDDKTSGGDSIEQGDIAAQNIITNHISSQLGAEILPNDPDVDVRQVRLVAPNKWQYCVSFRLPAEVAFRKIKD